MGVEQNRTVTLQNPDVVPYKDVYFLGTFIHANLQRYLEKPLLWIPVTDLSGINCMSGDQSTLAVDNPVGNPWHLDVAQ
jgi:hypothetical protein